MDKTDLVQLFDKVLKPHGFKKKGNYWRLDCDELIKIVNLQKSQYGDQYYINYGFDFKELIYQEVTMHIYRRLGTNDSDGNNILDFENNISGDRIKAIENLLTNSLFKVFDKINSVEDMINDLNDRPHLNDVPLKVKEFLGIEK